MEKEQAREWAEAQKIAFSVDLVEAAKKHLKFLAEVERNRFLYEDHVLQRAIYRYNAFWLPLLAKHMENPVCQDLLVVPLDCEWIWHCHRLNPIRYKSDCESLFGKVLGNEKVISSVHATSKNTTEEIWSQMYPDEPYELDLSRPFKGEDSQKTDQGEKFTSYDLISAVKRQMSFPFQMSRPYTSDDLFLQEGVFRYKGFLHLIRTNNKDDTKSFCVPTYDIDLIWHTHQLYPNSYCNDLVEAVGKVVHHNDNVSDRTPGKLLHTGFIETIKQWEETFGRRYRKAGTLYIGSSPTPVTQVPFKFNNVHATELEAFENYGKFIQFPPLRAVEVVLEFEDIKNLPEEHKGKDLIVSFSKKQPDKLFKSKRSLGISTEFGVKQIASLECEPTGEFFIEIMSCSADRDGLKSKRSLKLLGSCYLSLQDLISSGSNLSVDEWLPVELVPGLIICEPVALHVSVSFTPPMLAPQVFQLVKSQPFSMAKHANIPTTVIDRDGKEVFSLHMRNALDSLEVYYITGSGDEKNILATFKDNFWYLLGPHGLMKLQHNAGTDDSLFELVGYKMVKLFRGRRLKFETIHSEKNQKLKRGFMTAVEFSADYPYGKAVALIDLKSGTIKAIDEWIVLPVIALAFILSAVLRGEIDSDKDFDFVSDDRCASDCGGCRNMVESDVVVDNGVSGPCCYSECGLKCMLVCAHICGSKMGGQCAKCISCGVMAAKNDRDHEDTVNIG